MRTILLLFAVNAMLLFSCQQKNIETREAKHEHTSALYNEPDTPEELAGTKKWMTDESTRKHVAELGTRLNEFKLKKDADLASFKALGTDLSGELKKLISDCRMKGPDHDALHGWLSPLLEAVAGLNASETIEQGQLSVKKIDDILLDFHKRFE